MNQAACFSTEELRRYLLGELPESASDAVAHHIDSCSDCESTISLLDRESDTLVQSLRTPVDQPEPASAYRQAVKSAKSKWRDAASESGIEGVSDAPKLRDYELLEPLARGGMGTVYRARHTRLNRQVALKVLPGRWLRNPAAVARFEREMQAVGSLNHPSIVQATDGGEVDGVHFLVMELVDGFDGGTLASLLGPLPTADACEIARQVAEGMAYVHQQGIIHRDLKPSNLMITRRGDVKVLDLGLARLVDEQLAGDELTTIGQLMGTLDYMSPEQLENSHDVDQCADLYSLGATLYKLLTGDSPHASDLSEPFLSKLRRIASEPAAPLKQRRDDAPDELCELVDGLLARRVEDRPVSMESVAEMLKPFTVSSDLVRRTKEAAKIQKQRRNVIPMNSVDATAALHSDALPPPPAAVASRTRRLLSWAVALLLVISLGLGAVITLETTAGRLVIETASPNVEVRILKAGQVYRELTLSQKPKSLSLGAGEYRIEIISDADGLEIQNGQYTLKRGDTWLAKIVHREPSDQTAPVADSLADSMADASRSLSAGQPTYEGKTLPQWLSLLRTERSADQVDKACKALQKLGSEDDTATVDALLLAVKYHTGSSKPSGSVNTIWSSVQNVLAALDQTVVARAMAESLNDEGQANTPFILRYASDHASLLEPVETDGLVDQIQTIAATPLSSQRISALNAFKAIGSEETTERLLRSALDDAQVGVRLYAANRLIELDAHVAEVVSALREVVLSSDLRSRAQASWLLGEIGPEAKSAVPELVHCVEDQDLAVTLAGVYHTSDGTTSVKDAAIHALGEIGDESVAPLLIEEWNRRAFERRQVTKSELRELNDYGNSATYQPDWVAASIKRLIGRRPNVARRPDRTSVLVWSIDGRTLDIAYRNAFDDRHRRTTAGLSEIAEQLLPISQPFERESARAVIEKASRLPDDEALELEIRMIELLAQFDDPKSVLKSMYRRQSSYAALSIDEADQEFRTKTLQQYQALAIRMIQSQENWKATYAEFLIELLGDRYPGAATSFLDLIDDFAPDKQVEGVVKIFHLIRWLGVDRIADASTDLHRWVQVPVNRAAIRKHLSGDSNRAWLDLVVGIYCWGRDNDLADEIVDQRFAEDSINRFDLFNELITAMNDQPKLSELIIKLFRHPALAEAATEIKRGDQTTIRSLRAVYLSKLLTQIARQHRSTFVPMLRTLAESGVHGESEAAKQLLDQWK
ncbi:Serine/threonine-protein kinase PknB [Stieleria neptunia]|uniref:Serine/threonine-protein kinase PknB n=1 Tax=Stieleria neptunia TaxID=2527979 RepID=A0A518HTD7_9BACT|nr:serine/threonine-protein kinase [Stieleria neptunia]QDV44084.1 Serine/threonine-protein kinase PknB [Stieleria neptunia]